MCACGCEAWGVRNLAGSGPGSAGRRTGRGRRPPRVQAATSSAVSVSLIACSSPWAVARSKTSSGASGPVRSGGSGCRRGVDGGEGRARRPGRRERRCPERPGERGQGAQHGIRRGGGVHQHDAVAMAVVHVARVAARTSAASWRRAASGPSGEATASAAAGQPCGGGQLGEAREDATRWSATCGRAASASSGEALPVGRTVTGRSGGGPPSSPGRAPTRRRAAPLRPGRASGRHGPRG